MTDTQQKGQVKWFNDDKGFGFIKRSDAEDVFVHHTAINATGRRTLHENDNVKFDLVKTERGWQAENVSVIEE